MLFSLPLKDFFLFIQFSLSNFFNRSSSVSHFASGSAEQGRARRRSPRSRWPPRRCASRAVAAADTQEPPPRPQRVPAPLRPLQHPLVRAAPRPQPHHTCWAQVRPLRASVGGHPPEDSPRERLLGRPCGGRSLPQPHLARPEDAAVCGPPRGGGSVRAHTSPCLPPVGPALYKARARTESRGAPEGRRLQGNLPQTRCAWAGGFQTHVGRAGGPSCRDRPPRGREGSR